MKEITLTSLLGDIAAEAGGSLGKTASAGDPDASSPLFTLTEEELNKLADDLEGEGHVNDAAERIVQMKKEAAVRADQGGPTALDIFIEMRKVAFHRAAAELGLAPKTAGDGTASVMQLLFGGANPLQKLSEVAAYYYLGRLTNAPANDEGSGR